ncbi:MAG: threonine/serine exporter, partial [Lawsonibacter sp.]|nr:threonine/serine exporter [Lawsonibacter sp.]
MGTIWSGYILPCLCSFLACVGFTLVFNIHGVGKLICGVGGALGWLVYLLAGSTIFAAFLASAVIGLFSEIMARLRRKHRQGPFRRLAGECPGLGHQQKPLLGNSFKYL